MDRTAFDPTIVCFTWFTSMSQMRIVLSIEPVATSGAAATEDLSVIHFTQVIDSLCPDRVTSGVLTVGPGRTTLTASPSTILLLL